MSVSTSSDKQSAAGGSDPAPKPSSRAFSSAYKLAMVAEYESTPNGEKGALLRREDSVQRACTLTGISRATYYRRAKPLGPRHGPWLRVLTRSGELVPYSAPQTASASADIRVSMNVVNSERSRSGDAAVRCSCRNRAGSILGVAIAWISSSLSGNSVRMITRWPPHVYAEPRSELQVCRKPLCRTQLGHDSDNVDPVPSGGGR